LNALARSADCDGFAQLVYMPPLIEIVLHQGRDERDALDARIFARCRCVATRPLRHGGRHPRAFQGSEKFPLTGYIDLVPADV
jgi:hypothetical protein